jgi:hypothetical protein
MTSGFRRRSPPEWWNCNKFGILLWQAAFLYGTWDRMEKQKIGSRNQGASYGR